MELGEWLKIETTIRLQGWRLVSAFSYWLGSSSTKSRQTIYGGRIIGAKIRAEAAREAAQKAMREVDRAKAEAWSIQMEGYGGPAQPSPTIAQCLNGGYGWLGVECTRCKTRASVPLDAIRRPHNTPIWKPPSNVDHAEKANMRRPCT
jgi:hypothetical protein